MTTHPFTRSLLPLLAVLAALATGCSRQTFDETRDRAALLALDAEWSRITSQNTDVDRMVSYWTDDAVVYPPGKPVVRGKAALRAFVEAGTKLPGFHVQWMSDSVTFSPDGRLAYMQGTNDTRVPTGDGTLLTLHGRSVTIWRREPDGSWRCAVDIWNNEPASQPPTR